MTADEGWWLSALCAQTDPAIFFGIEESKNQYDNHRFKAQAKATCAACEVRRECLDEALSKGERWGIRGGLSPAQRARMVRAQQTEQAQTEGLAA